MSLSCHVFLLHLFIYLHCFVYVCFISAHYRLFECWDHSQPQLWWGRWSRLDLWTFMSGSWQFPLLPAFPISHELPLWCQRAIPGFLWFFFSLCLSSTIQVGWRPFWYYWSSLVNWSTLDTSMGCCLGPGSWGLPRLPFWYLASSRPVPRSTQESMWFLLRVKPASDTCNSYVLTMFYLYGPSHMILKKQHISHLFKKALLKQHITFFDWFLICEYDHC